MATWMPTRPTDSWSLGKGTERPALGPDNTRTDGTLERSAFTFDHEDDSYICPAGKRLRQRQKVYREDRPFVDENFGRGYFAMGRNNRIDETIDGHALRDEGVG